MIEWLADGAFRVVMWWLLDPVGRATFVTFDMLVLLACLYALNRLRDS